MANENGVFADPASDLQQRFRCGVGGVSSLRYLHEPRDVFVDQERNLYIADSENHRIRKVDASGIITTVAGNGERGFGGDGGPALQARLHMPNRVFVDGSGTLFIADTNNHRIRKVDTSGIITTVAGNGSWGTGENGAIATRIELNGYGLSSLFVDEKGDLYFYGGNSRVQRIEGIAAPTKFSDGETAIIKERDIAPVHLLLFPNYPNPFNSSTVIRFALPEYQEIELSIFNLAGQKVATLVKKYYPAGVHTVSWDGRDDDGRELASGVYLYRLRTGDGQEVEMRKFLFLR